LATQQVPNSELAEIAACVDTESKCRLKCRGRGEEVSLQRGGLFQEIYGRRRRSDRECFFEGRRCCDVDTFANVACGPVDKTNHTNPLISSAQNGEASLAVHRLSSNSCFRECHYLFALERSTAEIAAENGRAALVGAALSKAIDLYGVSGCCFNCAVDASTLSQVLLCYRDDDAVTELAATLRVASSRGTPQISERLRVDVGNGIICDGRCGDFMIWVRYAAFKLIEAPT
jgi:hypothetical protein